MISGHGRDVAGELCPRCGAVLDPVDDLREIVGYAVVRPPSTQGSNLSEAFAERIDDAIADRLASRFPWPVTPGQGIGDHDVR
jgi:hypothetical protein